MVVPLPSSRCLAEGNRIFSWVILELAGREWCTVPPPPGGEPSLGDGSPLGGGGTVVPRGGMHMGGGRYDTPLEIDHTKQAKLWTQSLRALWHQVMQALTQVAALLLRQNWSITVLDCGGYRAPT